MEIAQSKPVPFLPIIPPAKSTLAVEFLLNKKQRKGCPSFHILSISCCSQQYRKEFRQIRLLLKFLLLQQSLFFQSRSEEHTSELQSRQYLVCRLLLEKKKK